MSRGFIAVLVFVLLVLWLPYPEFIADVFPLPSLWLQAPSFIAFLICTKLYKEAPHPCYSRVEACLRPIWIAVIVIFSAIIWPLTMVFAFGVIDLERPPLEGGGVAWLNWKLLIAACLIAPVFEELYFRQGLFSVIQHPLAYFLVSTTLFVWCHTYSFELNLQNLNHLGQGAILSGARILGTRLREVMVLHAVMALSYLVLFSIFT